MALKGAIFDMDGVLVDNMRVHLRALGEFARSFGVETIDEERLMSMNGMASSEFFKVMLPPEVIERIGYRQLNIAKEQLYREMYAPELTAAAGLIALLEDFRSHGVKMAVGTSAITENLDFVLDGLGIRHFFDVLVTADMVVRAKPDPAIYLRALSELGLSAGECLVFEDALKGIEAARAAGIKTVALSTSTAASVLAATPGVVLTAADFTSLDFEKLNSLF
jgi:HAD superfamily hydrolase (TIGR01509 family)